MSHATEFQLQTTITKPKISNSDMVMEHIARLLVDLGQNYVFVFLLIVVLEIVAPSWAISNTPTD